MVFEPQQFVRYYNLPAENGILEISMDETKSAVIAGSGESEIIFEYGGRFRALIN